MALDPNKQRKIVVVHGVQRGDDDGLSQDEQIKHLIDSRLGDIQLDYEVVLYKYENINNDAQNKLTELVGSIISIPIGSIVAKEVIDLAGDVVISLAQGKVAAKIRKGLKDKILGYYNDGHPVYLVAHSLGSVYSFDVINQLIKTKKYFNRDNRLTWPVLGMVSFGSPLGLGIFKITGRDKLENMGDGLSKFHWRNYYDINDPIVSGKIFGTELKIEKIAENFIDDDNPKQGWRAWDYSVNTGNLHVLAHTAYWNLFAVGEGIRNMTIE